MLKTIADSLKKKHNHIHSIAMNGKNLNAIGFISSTTNTEEKLSQCICDKKFLSRKKSKGINHDRPIVTKKIQIIWPQKNKNTDADKISQFKK